MDINVDLLKWSINILTKKLLAGVLKMKLFLIKNQQINYRDQSLENPKNEIGKVNSTFIDNIWVADLADM